MTLIQRSKAVLNVYLILKKKDQILLTQRKNTGYFDGYYSLVSGHVEENESATLALKREAKEEIGITISPEHLIFHSLMHRKTDRNNIDLFFECSIYDHEIVNLEPHKCADVCFFPLNQLPEKTIPYIQQALLNNVEKYHEEGWSF